MKFSIGQRVKIFDGSHVDGETGSIIEIGGDELISVKLKDGIIWPVDASEIKKNGQVPKSN